MTEKTLSQAQFARRVGVSAMAVSRWRVQGWLVTAADGRIDVAASEERLRTRPEVYRGGEDHPTALTLCSRFAARLIMRSRECGPDTRARFDGLMFATCGITRPQGAVAGRILNEFSSCVALVAADRKDLRASAFDIRLRRRRGRLGVNLRGEQSYDLIELILIHLALEFVHCSTKHFEFALVFLHIGAKDFF
jgi:hypothetical protein